MTNPDPVRSETAATSRRILVVEDDPKISESLCRSLGEIGYSVESTADGSTVLGRVQSGSIDLVLLDLMIPGLDGLSVLREVRALGESLPVIVLSALTDIENRLSALRAGADDYLLKPFSFAELTIRMENCFRKYPSEAGPPVLNYDDLRMSLIDREFARGGARIELQPREFALLELFLRHPEKLLTKTFILEKIWNFRFDPQTNVVDVLVCRLRSKVDRGFPTRLLHTIRGTGYVLKRD